jgi:site-specific DNA recombinase
VGDRGDDLISPDLQIRDMDAFAKREGIQVVDRIIDLDQTGRHFEKRSVKLIIDRIAAGEADGVLVWKWSRWGRNLLQSKIYIAKVEQVGGIVRAATEDFDPDTTMGKFTRDQLLLIEELKSNQIGDDWKAVQRRRIDLGLPAGGAPPLGYARNGGGPFVPDPVYGPVIREMYEMYLRGVGPQGIANALNDRGLKTPKHSERYGGKQFGVPTIARALDSGFAAGFINRHGERVRGAHEPLIDEATWRRYEEEREKRRVVNPKSRQPRWFLGAGLAVCGRCGQNLVVDSYRSSKSQAVCSTYKSKRTCKGSWVDRVKLETLVALWLGGHVDEWTQAAEAVHDVDDERTRLARQVDAERAEEAKLRDGLRRAARLVASGDMTDEDYGDAKRQADTRLREVTARLADLQSRLDALDPAGDAYERLSRALGRGAGATTERPVDVAVPFDVPDGAVWPTEQVTAMAPEEWHALLRKIIRRVVVNERTIMIEPWNGEPTRYDRAVVMPPRKRSDVQVRDEKGRFVKSAA